MLATSAEIEAVFYEALQKEPLSEQAAYLDHACGEDAELRSEVESLLTAHAKAVGVFERPSGVLDGEVAKPTEGPGTLIGHYKLLEVIGEGGFGVVYLAEQTEPVQRRVALKIIKPGMDSQQVIARFEAEEQALAMMDHPHIATVHDAGATESGRPYFVMELVDGIPLTEYCDANNLTAEERLGLFIDVCHAVQHAHQKGIIHRDIKPTNVMVALQDGVPVPKIIDFGIAKATDRHLTERTAFTSYGQMIGTPLYMSPEQAEMSGLDIDTRSDIYSLGVLLYELLTGSTPFDEERIRAAGYDEMRRLIREEEPPRPSDRISSLAAEAATTASTHRKTDPAKLSHLLRGELDWIVMKALEKDRTRRYETANAVAKDIQRYLHNDPVEACPPSASYRLRKFARRHRVAFVTTSLVAAALVLGIAGTTWQAIRATIESNRAGKAEQAARDRYQGELAARQEMERQRDRAEAAETEAKAEASIAQAINDFLRNDLLAEAAPEKNARNEKVTVEELLGRAASKIAGKFDQQPRIEAAILRTIGETYRALGDYEAAQPHLERALQLGRRSVGEEHPDTLTTIDSLGLLYLEHGRPAEAELLLAKNLEVRSRVLGKEHEDTLESMNNLAGAHYGQRRYDEAEQLLAETLEIRRRINGEEHAETLMVANNLASIYIRHGQIAKAEMLVAKNVEILSRLRGKEHPNTILAMHNLAVLCDEQGRHAEAESLFVEALGAARRVLGEEHPSTLSYMQSLASLLDRQDRDVEAESLYVEALDASRRVLGEEHTETLGCLDSLVTLYLSQGNPKAESLFVELVALQRRALGDEHPDTLDSMRALAMFYAFEDQPTKTGQLLLEILEIRRRTLGEEQPDTQTAIDALLGHYRNQGQLDQAEQLLRRSLEILEQSAPDAWTTFHTKSRLGDVLVSQQKFAEAESLLLAGYEGMSQRAEKIPPPHKKYLTQALQRIIRLYKAWDKPHQTPQWRAKLKALNQENDEQLKTDTRRNREAGEHKPPGN